MRLTIIPSDSVVGVDGEFRVVDLTEIPSDVHAVQWDDATDNGEIEFKQRGRSPEPITSRVAYDNFVSRWQAAPPSPPSRSQPPVDGSDPENLDKEARAMIEAIAALTGKTSDESRAAYTYAYKALP